MAARTEGCVVVLPTGNRTGTVKMLSIATGRRDQFKILPMPESARVRLNERDGVVVYHCPIRQQKRYAPNSPRCSR